MRGCIGAKEADRPPLRSPGARRPQKKNGGLDGSCASLVLSSQPLPGEHISCMLGFTHLSPRMQLS